MNTDPPASLPEQQPLQNSPDSASPPPRADPVNSGLFRWLNVGVVLGATATLGVSAAVTFLGAQHLVVSGSYWLLGWAAAGTVCSAALILKIYAARKSPLEWMSGLSASTQGKRVERLMRGLSVASELPMPRVELSTFIMTLAMIDRPVHRDTVLYNPALVIRLTDQELKGVIAHELEHADRIWSVYNVAALISRSMAANFAALAVAAIIYDTWRALASSGSASAAVLAGVGMLATGVVVRFGLILCHGISSRANEIRTDIRAVQRTQDLGSYLSALEKCYNYTREKIRPSWRMLQPIGTHPSLDLRKRWIRRACGG